MDVNILAYDKVYQIELETDDQEKFDKYALFVEEIANSIKISKPAEPLPKRTKIIWTFIRVLSEDFVDPNANKKNKN